MNWEGNYELPSGAEVLLCVAVRVQGETWEYETIEAFDDDGTRVFLLDATTDAIKNDATLMERIEDEWRDRTSDYLENHR